MGGASVDLLLDTHIWIWSLLEPARLSRPVGEALGDPTNQLWLSPISIWEFLLLVERGRVHVERGMAPRAWVDAALTIAPMRDAPLTREVGLYSRTIELDHEDPADRLLATTAAVYDLTLVTGDERLLGGSGFLTLANR